MHYGNKYPGTICIRGFRLFRQKDGERSDVEAVAIFFFFFFSLSFFFFFFYVNNYSRLQKSLVYIQKQQRFIVIKYNNGFEGMKSLKFRYISLCTFFLFFFYKRNFTTGRDETKLQIIKRRIFKIQPSIILLREYSSRKKRVYVRLRFSYIRVNFL